MERKRDMAKEGRKEEGGLLKLGGRPRIDEKRAVLLSKFACKEAVLETKANEKTERASEKEGEGGRGMLVEE